MEECPVPAIPPIYSSKILTNVVLHCVHCIWHLPMPAPFSQLIAQFHSLSNSRGPNWMALADEPTAGIYHPFSAICVVASVHNITSLPNGAKAQCLVSDQFIGCKAIVKLNDLKMPKSLKIAMGDSVRA